MLRRLARAPSCELQELEPEWKMMMFERLGAPGEESSNGFNNAGWEQKWPTSKGDS